MLLSPGSPYYDNVRPLCYSDCDAVLLCFDISRPDTVDAALKKVRVLFSFFFVFECDITTVLRRPSDSDVTHLLHLFAVES